MQNLTSLLALTTEQPFGKLPAPLLQQGPRGLLYWQWLALPALVLIAWVLGYVLSRATRLVFGRLAAHTHATWDDELVRRLGAPLTLGWGIVVAFILLPWLDLSQVAFDFLCRILRGALLLAFFWAVGRSVNVVIQIIGQSSWARGYPASRTLLPVAARVAQVGVLAIALVALLADLGYPVASLITGLGIGGLALALAAQKTVENLFGAFSIGADQAFREGDTIRVDGIEGTVEKVGLRSTRIRSADRTMFNIPNGKLSEMRIESFASRDRIRLACTLGLSYGTSAEQMRQVLSGFEEALREHPKTWPNSLTVCFKEIGESSLNIEVIAWFRAANWEEFLVIRQEMLLRFMDVVEKAGSSFAFPTRTVHLIPGVTPGAS